MKPQGPNERCRGWGGGQNKLFQNESFLTCCYSFEIGQFSTLKYQSERQAIELLFKAHISVDYPSSNTN